MKWGARRKPIHTCCVHCSRCTYYVHISVSWINFVKHLLNTAVWIGWHFIISVRFFRMKWLACIFALSSWISTFICWWYSWWRMAKFRGVFIRIIADFIILNGIAASWFDWQLVFIGIFQNPNTRWKCVWNVRKKTNTLGMAKNGTSFNSWYDFKSIGGRSLWIVHLHDCYLYNVIK